MLLKLPQDVYEAVVKYKGELSPQAFIIKTLKQELLTTLHGEKHEQREKDNTKE